MKNIFYLITICLFGFFLVQCQTEIAQTEKPMPTPQESFLFIGTYTEKEPHVHGKGEGIYVYKMDAKTGALSFVNKATGTINPSYLAPHPNKRFIYAVNEIGNPEGTVSAFEFNEESGQLTFLNKVSAKGKAPCYISLDAAGDYAFIANYVTGNVAMLPVQNDGQLSEAIAVINHEGKGSHARQEAPHAHFIAPHKNGKMAFAVDLGIDKIKLYQIDSQNGGLLPAGEIATTNKASGPRHLAWHPKKEWFYVVNELDGTIEGFKQDSTTWSSFQIISTLPNEGEKSAGCADIHLTPNGRFLYATNRGALNNIAMYQVNEQSGILTFLGNQSTKGKTPRNFIISENGQFLLVANQDSDNIVTFKINQQTGKLEDTGLEVKVNTPVCLKFL